MSQLLGSEVGSGESGPAGGRVAGDAAPPVRVVVGRQVEEGSWEPLLGKYI